MPTWLPLLLGFLSALNPLSTDMYLPAFPALEAEFGGQRGGAQVTLAAWFLGLTFGQLTQGALSDRLGRRVPLLLGTTVYTAATVACALAPDMASLAVWRAVAAFAGSASAVVPRAVVRDLATGPEAVRVMSRLILVMGAAPILAPSLGGLLLEVSGWRSIFWFMALYGALSCLLVWRFLPETLPPEARSRASPLRMLRAHGKLLADRHFLVHALLSASVMFGMFAYIAGAPAVFVEGFGLSPSAFGVLFGVAAAGFVGGAQLNPWLGARLGPGRLLTLASAGSAVSGALLLLLALAGAGGVWGVFLPVLAILAAGSLVMPNATVGALARQGSRAGTASALIGTLGFAAAAAAALLTGALADGTARPMGVLALLGGVSALALDAARRRLGES